MLVIVLIWWTLSVSASAAGQAITTYIRNHLQRCEVQQDHPLLLRHVLSGTPSDDDLVPALHSRAGGAHCSLPPGEKRITNFRRGTVVWYLSRAAGVPCPFSRAGIRLCEYNENGRVGTAVNPGKERKRERDRMRRAEQSGQKRKRLPRACATKHDSDTDSSGDEDAPPPKVKLTLRLKPVAAFSTGASSSSGQVSSPEIVDLSRDSDSESDDESMSEDSTDEEEEGPTASWPQPSYVPRSMDIQPYTPSVDAAFSPLSPVPSASQPADRPWRSPSVPFSATSASPPPDSEEEEEDEEEEGEDADMDMDGDDTQRIYSMSYRYDSPSFEDDDLDLDLDDYDTQWGESPGPMSPPAQYEDEDVQVKQEPQDVSGFLDAWESLESNVAELKVIDIITQAAAAAALDDDIKPKREEVEFDWAAIPDFDSDAFGCPSDSMLPIKQEEEDGVIPPLEYTPMSPLSSPVTPYSALPSPMNPCDSPVVETFLMHRRYTEPVWQDAVLLGPDSVKLKDLDDGDWQVGIARQDRKSCPDVLNASRDSSSDPVSSPCSEDPRPQDARAAVQASVEQRATPFVPSSPAPSASCSNAERPSHSADSASPSRTVEDLYSVPAPEEPVLVRTCEPCVPAICATALEGTHVLIASLSGRVLTRAFASQESPCTKWRLTRPSFCEESTPTSSTSLPFSSTSTFPPRSRPRCQAL